MNHASRFSPSPVLLLSMAFGLAGCGGFSHSLTTPSPQSSTLGTLQGRVHGGKQPVVGAHVYLYATGTTGTAGKDIPGTASNASTSLLTSAGSNVTFDGTNYYVTTDASGGFSISGDYTCTSGTQLYLYVIGGNPGAGTNSRAAFLSGIGACPSSAATAANAFFWVNEVTTVATAYALAGYATDALHISSATSAPGNPADQLAYTGMVNAMANVNALVNVGTGAALTSTPAGNGTVPQAEIDTLANILASCVNSSDAAPSACTSLFNTALSDGTAGTAPTDTASAAINIAHNAAQNAMALYNLQPASAAPYMPSLTTAPNDFGIFISFSGGGIASPHALSIDASGNVWGASGALVTWLSPLGVPLAPSGLATSSANSVASLTFDNDGDVWALDTKGRYSEFTSAGTLATASGGVYGPNSGTSAVTVDSFGFLWSADSSDGTVFRFDPVAQASVSSAFVGSSSFIAGDPSGFVWLAASGGTLYKLDQTAATVAKYPSLYTAAASLAVDSTSSVYVDDSTTKTIDKVTTSGTTSSFADGVGGATALAFDGAGNVWSGRTTLSLHTNTGTNLSGAAYQLPFGEQTTSLAIDGSGNVWVAGSTENGAPGTHITELIGAAAPVQTPLTYVTTHGTLQNALNLTMGFNGPDVQFPYMDQFYAAQSTYYQSLGTSYPSGARYCHAYLSWDIAEEPVGNGPLYTEGSRSWFEDWLGHAQGHCDRALITFKYVGAPSGSSVPVTTHDVGTYPSVSDYQTAMAAFLATNWSYTGWTGVFDYTPWNEPQNGSGSGDGLSVAIPVENDADYYLALRQLCLPANGCNVAAGDFASNGTLYKTFVQNCTTDLTTPCSGASYMDQFKYYVVNDAATYGFSSSFRPEIFGFHDWDDINNYINNSSHCTSETVCTTRALLNALSTDGWNNTTLWDTEVAAGQAGSSNPTTYQQGCAASFLLDLTGALTSRITRLYWTQPYTSDGMTFAMFDANGNPKPSFYVMAQRNIAYVPPAGNTCQ